jgi:hypothetical protein
MPMSSLSSSVTLMSILLKLPISVVERTYLTCLQPSWDAMKVKCMITHSPSYSTFFWGCWCLVCLTFYTQVHYMISANGTIVNNDIPSPQRDGVPFLYFEPFLFHFTSTRWRRHLRILVNLHWHYRLVFSTLLVNIFCTLSLCSEKV